MLFIRMLSFHLNIMNILAVTILALTVLGAAVGRHTNDERVKRSQDESRFLLLKSIGETGIYYLLFISPWIYYFMFLVFVLFHSYSYSRL